LAPGVGGNFITVGEGAKTYLGTTALDAAAGASGITLKDAAALQVGEVIYLYQPNTADYLLANGWNNVTMEEAASRPFREFITTVTAIDGNGVTLADPLPYDFAATETRAFTMDVLANVVLKDFTVTSVLGTADAHAFTNTLPGFDGASAITAQGTIGLTLLNLTITDSPSTALSLQSSIHAAVTDVVISGSHNKGSDGNGYGVLLSEAFNNDFSGLSITDMRHAVVFSAWNAETGNSIGVADTNRDVNFHGSPDVGNVVTVTNAILDYDITVDPSVWSLVSGGGTNHAATDIASNAVRFFHGEGSGNVDTIHGADGGSYLNGHGSNDVLVGGNGDDMIVGGLRRDLLTGGDGADTFLFKMGDDLDTITDMDFSAGGDRIVIMGNVAVDGFEDLVFTQDGADLRVRYGSNSTIILKDTLRADVDAAHFVFDPQSSQFLDDWNGGL
jgi:Ca2+-binding RTX toxin-like protein